MKIFKHVNQSSIILSYIYLASEQQRLVANSLHFSLSMARYLAFQKPMPSRSFLSCSAQEVLGRPLGRFQPGPDALPQRASVAVKAHKAHRGRGYRAARGPRVRRGQVSFVWSSNGSVMVTSNTMLFESCYIDKLFIVVSFFRPQYIFYIKKISLHFKLKFLWWACNSCLLAASFTCSTI